MLNLPHLPSVVERADRANGRRKQGREAVGRYYNNNRLSRPKRIKVPWKTDDGPNQGPIEVRIEEKCRALQHLGTAPALGHGTRHRCASGDEKLPILGSTITARNALI